MTLPRRGEVWWLEGEERRRPVLVLSRDPAIPVMRRITVAPLTRTIRGIASEVPLGPDDGVPAESVVSMDNLAVVDRSTLTTRITRLRADRMVSACRALRFALDC